MDTIIKDLAVKRSKSLFVSKSKVVEIIAALLVLLFVYASVSKLLEFKIFRLQLSKSPFITDFAGLISWALPLAEILLGTLLMFKKTRLIGLYLSLYLMTVFTTYIYAMLKYSYFLPCSCGGILAKMDWVTHFWFNVFFLVLNIIGLILEYNILFKASNSKIINK